MIQAKTGMLVRRPVAEVFEAFVDPEITRRFWFTQGSGRLEKGKQVHWEWEMYGITVPVDVKDVEPPRRIVVEWSGPKGANRVEWYFTQRDDGTTFVEITNDGLPVVLLMTNCRPIGAPARTRCTYSRSA